MAEKEKKQVSETKTHIEESVTKTNNITRKLIGFSLLLFSILTLVAIIFDKSFLEVDYNNIFGKGIINFFKKMPGETQNPIGIFGVFFGYWFVNIFGKIFGITILFLLAAWGEVIAFVKESEDRKRHHHIFFSFANLMFFISIFILNIKGSANLTFKDGLIPIIIFNGMLSLFKQTGIYIIACILMLLSIFLVYDRQHYNSLLLGAPIFILRFIWFGFLFLGKKFVSLFKRRPKQKTSYKNEKLDEINFEEDKLNTNTLQVEDNDEEEFEEYEETNSFLISKNNIEDFDTESDDLPLLEDINVNQQENLEGEEILVHEEFETKVGKPKIENVKSPNKYIKPDIETFLQSPILKPKRNREELQTEIREISKILIDKLAEFGVQAEVVNVNIGPIITQYELKPAPGVSVKKFTTLADDLAMAIKAESIRVQAPIPGRGLVGVEIPNAERDIILLKDVLLSEKMLNSKLRLGIALGKDIAGRPIVADLTKMPHLLIAGATGAGKSVCINTIIASLLFRETPEDLRLIMIDPKKVELAMYEEIPHLIQNVVTEPEDALAALNWGVMEMERRYSLLNKYKVRDFLEYNKKVERLKAKDPSIDDEKIPYIVIVVDEFADLIMTAGKDIEQPICRLAQMARAIGIHLILATQRPSTKVITGIIKANFPARIAFRVSSKIDSRVILDTNGAEQLLGMGDMLFIEKSNPKRVHGTYVSTEEIESITDYLALQPKPENDIKILKDEDDLSITGDIDDFDFDDELFPEAAALVVRADTASVSMLQRHFKIGYARAGRLVDLMERAGVIGPHVGSKSRDVLWTIDDLNKNGFSNDS